MDTFFTICWRLVVDHLMARQVSETSSGKQTRLQVNPAAVQERQEQVLFWQIWSGDATASHLDLWITHSLVATQWLLLCPKNKFSAFVQARPTHSGCFSRSSPSPTFARWNIVAWIFFHFCLLHVLFSGSIGAVLDAAVWYDAPYLTKNRLKFSLVRKL